MRKSDLAWAAGFFEGEGSVGAFKTGRPRKDGTRRIGVSLSINQVDRECLDRFREVVGVGRIYGPYERKGGKPQFVFSVSNNKVAVAQVFSMLAPWLSTRRIAQFEKALT